MPADTSVKFLQRFLLPLLPFCGRFDYDVFDFLEQGGAPEFQPIEYISCEPSIVRARFDDLQSVRSAFGKPLRKLKRKQFAKQRPNAYTGVKISTPANRVLFSFVESTIGTIQRQFHEAGEGNLAISRDFGPDFAVWSIQNLALVAVWCGFS